MEFERYPPGSRKIGRLFWKKEECDPYEPPKPKKCEICDGAYVGGLFRKCIPMAICTGCLPRIRMALDGVGGETHERLISIEQIIGLLLRTANAH